MELPPLPSTRFVALHPGDGSECSLTTCPAGGVDKLLSPGVKKLQEAAYHLPGGYATAIDGPSGCEASAAQV